MERILIGDDSEILVGRGWPEPLLPSRRDRRRAAVFTQPGAATIAQDVTRTLESEGVEASLHVLPDGEAAKAVDAIEAAWSRLADHQLGRADTVVAVGGGALTDAAGFVAGTWLRGVEAVYFPTTLLGAVDAAVGGKTGINVGGKNLVGMFRHPHRVVVDLDVLDKLPTRLRREGAAEVIKAGLLAAPWIVDAYRQAGTEVAVDEVVPAAIEIKAEIVRQDFTEEGRRAFLNLGHTIGHGVEFSSGLSHGESVSVGLLAAAAVSERRFGFAGVEIIREALIATGLPTVAPSLDPAEIRRLIGLDKKKLANSLRMVLLEEIGSPQLVDVDDSDIDAGLAAIGV